MRLLLLLRSKLTQLTGQIAGRATLSIQTDAKNTWHDGGSHPLINRKLKARSINQNKATTAVMIEPLLKMPRR